MERSVEASVGRVPIVNVQPSLEEGRWPARAVIGEAVPISATIFREGHDAEGATVVVTDPDGKSHSFPMPLRNWGNALYEAQFLPVKEGLHSFRVEAWSDPVATWLHAAEVKIHAGVDVQLMLDEGVDDPLAGPRRGSQAAPGARGAHRGHRDALRRATRRRMRGSRPRCLTRSGTSSTRLRCASR